jgi:cell division control protein 6
MVEDSFASKLGTLGHLIINETTSYIDNGEEKEVERNYLSPYNANELRDILELRASMAFQEGALDSEVVPLVSAFAASKNGDARYGLDLLSLCGRICEEEDRDRITEEDVRQAQRLADMMLVYRAVSKLTSSQKLLLYAIYTTKDTSPTTIYGCYNRLISDGMNGSKLTTKWPSILAQELELLGFVDIHRKGRGRGTDFTIQPSGSIDRKYMVETLTSMVV